MVILLACLLLQDLDALIDQLRSDDAGVRDKAAAALRVLKPDSAAVDEKLEAAADSRDLEIAARARAILSHRRMSRLGLNSDEVIRALGDGPGETRKEITFIIIGAARATRDREWMSKLAAVFPEGVRESLLSQVRSIIQFDDCTPAACALLGAFKDVDSIPLLLRVVKLGGWRLDGTESDMTAIAAERASLMEIWRLNRPDHTTRGLHTPMP